MATRAERTTISSRQVIALNAILELHCTRGDDNMATYEKGWDDDRTLIEFEKVNPEPKRNLSLSSIRRMRQDVFGRLRKMSPAGVAANGWMNRAETDIDGLRASVGNLTDQVRELKQTVAELCRRAHYNPPPGRPVSTPPDPGIITKLL